MPIITATLIAMPHARNVVIGNSPERRQPRYVETFLTNPRLMVNHYSARIARHAAPMQIHGARDAWNPPDFDGIHSSFGRVRLGKVSPPLSLRRRGETSHSALTASAQLQPHASPRSTEGSEEISARLKQANSLRAKGHIEEAADAYRSVIALDPDHVVALAALGNIATRLRDFDAALNYLRAASALDPKNHKWLMAIGDVLRQASRLEEARAIYEKVAADDPSNERAAACLGLIARQNQDAAKTKPATISVRRETEDVEDIAARLKQANSLRAKGRLEEAADAYRNVIALDPDHGVALAALGNIATRLRDFDAALKYLQAASARDPKNHKLLMAVGDVLRQMSRLEEARAVYEKIAAEDPSNERAATCLGLIARQNHETAKAIFHFERALTIDPNGQIAKDMLAQLRSENVSRESAKNEHLRILEEDPQNSRSLVALARLARRDGEHEQAQKYLEAASLANPADLQLCAEHADELRELRRFDEAEAIYKDVLSTGGDNAKALTGLGFIERARGNSDAAAGYFKAATELKRKGNEDLTAGFASRIEDGNDLLKRMFPGLVAQATLPTLLDYNRAALLVAPCRGASSLVITFGGNTAQLALPSEITTLENTHVIAIRDPQRCFSLRGLPGLGETYWACLHNIRRLMTEFGVTNLYCLGVSAGGYSALRYGLDLGADGVLVFSAPTTLDLADDDDAPLSRYPQLTALYRDLPDIRLDLAKLYEAKLPRPRAILVYSPSDKRDCWLADRMRGINGVKLDVAPKEAGHRVFSWLKAANRISPYIDRLLALRPVAGPRLEQE